MFSTVEHIKDWVDQKPIWNNSYRSKCISIENAAALVYRSEENPAIARRTSAVSEGNCDNTKSILI